jgi:hypothetical protein
MNNNTQTKSRARSVTLIRLGLLLLTAWAPQARLAFGQDITFTNRLVTFTNLQGRIYNGVVLVKADLDGVLWREVAGDGLGWVCYTNVSPALLEAWGIPSNRVDTAKARAERRAAAYAKHQAFQTELAQQKAVTAQPPQELRGRIVKVLPGTLVLATFTVEEFYRGDPALQLKTRHPPMDQREVPGKTVLLRGFPAKLQPAVGQTLTCRASRAGTTAYNGDTFERWDYKSDGQNQ